MNIQESDKPQLNWEKLAEFGTSLFHHQAAFALVGVFFVLYYNIIKCTHFFF